MAKRWHLLPVPYSTVLHCHSAIVLAFWTRGAKANDTHSSSFLTAVASCRAEKLQRYSSYAPKQFVKLLNDSVFTKYKLAFTRCACQTDVNFPLKKPEEESAQLFFSWVMSVQVRMRQAAATTGSQHGKCNPAFNFSIQQRSPALYWITCLQDWALPNAANLLVYSVARTHLYHAPKRSGIANGALLIGQSRSRCCFFRKWASHRKSGYSPCTVYNNYAMRWEVPRSHGHRVGIIAHCTRGKASVILWTRNWNDF